MCFDRDIYYIGISLGWFQNNFKMRHESLGLYFLQLLNVRGWGGIIGEHVCENSRKK
jgi:hypothetical protein